MTSSRFSVAFVFLSSKNFFRTFLRTFHTKHSYMVKCNLLSMDTNNFCQSKRHYKEKPFGVKWPDEPMKALGVYFTYDQKLLKEKNFIERLDSIKKLINIWSARGLSI